MFNFFSKKTIGIYLRGRQVTLVRIMKGRGFPKVDLWIQKEIPDPSDSKSVIAVLKSLRDEAGGGECVLSIPASKTYANLLQLPAGLLGEELEEAMKGKVASWMPSPLEEMVMEYAVMPEKKSGNSSVLLVGVEKNILDTLTEWAVKAGWLKPSFVLETLALEQVIPFKDRHSQAMYVHSFGGGEALIGSFYKGHSVDGNFTADLKNDFIRHYQSYVQMLGVPPTHVVLTGTPDGMAVLKSMKFIGAEPQLLEVPFLAEMKGRPEKLSDILMATGLGLSYGRCDKKSGRCLIRLVD